MTLYCNLCDKSKTNKSKYNHLKSVSHNVLDEPFIRKYIFVNHIFDQIDEIMKRYNNIFNKKYERY